MNDRILFFKFLKILVIVVQQCSYLLCTKKVLTTTCFDTVGEISVVHVVDDGFFKRKFFYKDLKVPYFQTVLAHHSASVKHVSLVDVTMIPTTCF